MSIQAPPPASGLNLNIGTEEGATIVGGALSVFINGLATDIFHVALSANTVTAETTLFAFLLVWVSGFRKPK